MMRVMYTSLFLVLTCALQAQSYVPEKQEPKMKIKPVVKIKAYSFDLQDVKLLDSRFKQNMEREQQWLLSIGANNLLHSFRTNAGVYSGNEGGFQERKLPGGNRLIVNFVVIQPGIYCLVLH